MKKFINSIIVLCIILSFISCVDEPNYDMTSEMNSLAPIEIIYIDEATVDVLGDFPISRAYYADLLHEVEKDEPAAVILKFFFDMPADEDEVLRSAISAYDNVLTQLTVSLDSLVYAGEAELAYLALPDFESDLPSAKDLLVPNATLFDSFSGMGFSDVVLDENEYQNMYIAVDIDGYVIPSLALSTVMLVTGEDAQAEKGEVTIGDSVIDVPGGSFRIDLSEPDSLYRTYSFIDVFNSEVEFNFEDKIVIVYVDLPVLEGIGSHYLQNHNNAEVIADSINSLLKRIGGS